MQPVTPLYAITTGAIILILIVLAIALDRLNRDTPCWCEGGPSRCGTCVDGDRLMEGER